MSWSSASSTLTYGPSARASAIIPGDPGPAPPALPEGHPGVVRDVRPDLVRRAVLLDDPLPLPAVGQPLRSQGRVRLRQEPGGRAVDSGDYGDAPVHGSARHLSGEVLRGGTSMSYRGAGTARDPGRTRPGVFPCRLMRTQVAVGRDVAVLRCWGISSRGSPRGAGPWSPPGCRRAGGGGSSGSFRGPRPGSAASSWGAVPCRGTRPSGVPPGSSGSCAARCRCGGSRCGGPAAAAVAAVAVTSPSAVHSARKAVTMAVHSFMTLFWVMAPHFRVGRFAYFPHDVYERREVVDRRPWRVDVQMNTTRMGARGAENA